MQYAIPLQFSIHQNNNNNNEKKYKTNSLKRLYNPFIEYSILKEHWHSMGFNLN